MVSQRDPYPRSRSVHQNRHRVHPCNLGDTVLLEKPHNLRRRDSCRPTRAVPETRLSRQLMVYEKGQKKEVIVDPVSDGTDTWSYGDPQSSCVPVVVPFVVDSPTRPSDGNGIVVGPVVPLRGPLEGPERGRKDVWRQTFPGGGTDWTPT